jgi:hypothetical protein
VAGLVDEGARLTRIAAVAENDARSALGETHGNGRANAPGGSGHQRNSPGVGFGGLMVGMRLVLSAMTATRRYAATAGFSTSAHHCRKLVGVEFSGVRRTPLSRPSFFAQAMSVMPRAIASDMPKLRGQPEHRVGVGECLVGHRRVAVRADDDIEIVADARREV